MHELRAHRGLLTGKFTKEEVPTEGRVGWVAQNESRGSHSHPAWSKVKDNDKVWNILDTCKKLADAHGESGADLGLTGLLISTQTFRMVLTALLVDSYVEIKTAPSAA